MSLRDGGRERVPGGDERGALGAEVEVGAIAGFGRERGIARRGRVVACQRGAREDGEEYEVSHGSASSFGGGALAAGASLVLTLGRRSGKAESGGAVRELQGGV
jgi:hypothetical protein